MTKCPLSSAPLLLLTLLSSARAEETPFDLARAMSDGPPLTVEEAVVRAERSAPALERVEALSRAARAAAARTRSELLPRLELVARYAHIDGFPDGRIDLTRDPAALDALRGLAAQVSDPASRALWQASLAQPTSRTIEIPRDQVAFMARLSWPVSDLFFAVVPAIAAADAQLRATRAEVDARRSRVRLSAREAYYELVRARGVLAVARRAVEQANAQHARMKSAVAAGMRAPSDEATAAARVAAAEQAVASAEAGVDVADAALRTLVGDADGEPYAIAEPLVDDAAEQPGEVALLLARARERRPELVALRQAMLARKKLTRVHAAAGYPHLGLFAGGDYARPNRYVIPPEAEFRPSWEVGAQLSYVPNDTLSAARRVREDEAQLDALAADMAELERALVLEIRRARAASVRAVRTLAAARTSESAAERAYAQRLAELQAGEVTSADLFAAEADLNRARLSVLDAIIERKVAHARLGYAVGER